jgi:DNA-binding response OmpR family regulator
MARIFYVEDDANLSFVVKDCLQMNGHEVHHYSKGDDALYGFNKHDFDICILDVMLPNVDGYTITKTIRNKNPHIPIIFISAKVQIEDKLEGLSIGGDDYIFKPFSFEELILKINIFLKRKHTSLEKIEKGILSFGIYTLDEENLLLKGNTDDIRLTQRECDLLAYFVKNSNKLLRREEILIALWGQDDYFLGRSLDVFISRVRKYISNDKNIIIENIPRVGFRMMITV